MTDNKNKIALVAFELSLEKGFDNVSIKQIQKEAKLSVGSIYYHFKNKHEILLHMIQMYLMDNFKVFSEDVKKFNGSFIERIEFIFNYKTTSFAKEELSQFISSKRSFNYKEYYMLLMTIFHQHPDVRQLVYEFHNKFYDFYCELVQEAIDNGEIRDDIDVKTLVTYLQTIMKGYVELWLFQNHLSYETIVDANVKMIEEAVKKQ